MYFYDDLEKYFNKKYLIIWLKLKKLLNILKILNHILNEMNSNEFCEYKNNLEYLEIIDSVNNLFHDYW